MKRPPSVPPRWLCAIRRWSFLFLRRSSVSTSTFSPCPAAEPGTKDPPLASNGPSLTIPVHCRHFAYGDRCRPHPRADLVTPGAISRPGVRHSPAGPASCCHRSDRGLTVLGSLSSSDLWPIPSVHGWVDVGLRGFRDGSGRHGG